MILLSAGHYPDKPGACFEDFCEHEEAVRWIEELHKHIPAAIRVPVGVLREKIAFINSRQPTIAAEIHFNSFKVWEDVNKDGVLDKDELIHKGRGALTLFYPGSIKGEFLATEVQHSMETVLSRHWDGVMEGWYRMDKKFGVDYFLQRTSCPSVIIEPEFIHRREVVEQYRAIVCKRIAHTLSVVSGIFADGD